MKPTVTTQNKMTLRNFIIPLFLIFFLLLSNSIDAQQSGEYERIILRAEQLLDQKNYRQAKQEYENALNVNPDASYPRIKLQQIREVYADPDDPRRYSGFVSEGDRLFNLQDYRKSREQFYWANIIKPDEKYPKDKLKELDELIKDLERKERLYERSVKSADSLYNLREYQAAMNEYLYASGLLPRESYPRNRVDQINKIFESARKEQAAYQKIIEEADQLYMIQDYNAALTAYNRALSLKPDDRYPASMIDRINGMESEQRSLEAVYASVIENADRLFVSADYSASKSAYEHALRLKPAESHPQKRIIEINTILDAKAMSEEAFLEALAAANNYYDSKEYPQALELYKKAEKIKALDAESLAKVSEIEKILEAELTFNNMLANADELFNKGRYQAARDTYIKLLELQPGNSHATSRIGEIDSIMANLEALEANYESEIKLADKAFNNKDYTAALVSYQKASGMKPSEQHPRQRIDQIQPVTNLLTQAERHYNNNEYQASLEKYNQAKNLLPLTDEALARISELEKQITDMQAYAALLKEANDFFNSGEYEKARIKYNDALQIIPGAGEASRKVAEIDALLTSMAEAERNYNAAIEQADEALKEKEFEKALVSYKQASNLKPDEKYPKDRIAEVEIVLKEIEAKRVAYNEHISLADTRYNAGQYQQAISAYQEALKFKPSDNYAESRISDARGRISEAEINEAYANALSSARFHEGNNDLESALISWETAAGLKPSENLPKERIAELGAIVAAERRKIQESYDKAIADGDRYFNTKVFDQAIESYNEAARLKPSESYPSSQINAIRRYIEERAIVDLVSEPISIVSGDEQRFSFKPVDMRVRRNNYVILTLKFSSLDASRFFLNYGLDGQRSGGIVVRNPGGKDESQFIVRVSSQDRWYRIDNNWISIYPEGSDVEVTQLRISSGD